MTTQEYFDKHIKDVLVEVLEKFEDEYHNGDDLFNDTYLDGICPEILWAFPNDFNVTIKEEELINIIHYFVRKYRPDKSSGAYFFPINHENLIKRIEILKQMIKDIENEPTKTV